MAVLQGGIYDDGQPDVPGGVTGPVERVVVVGAGIAGLTIANALSACRGLVPSGGSVGGGQRVHPWWVMS